MSSGRGLPVICVRSVVRHMMSNMPPTEGMELVMAASITSRIGGGVRAGEAGHPSR